MPATSSSRRVLVGALSAGLLAAGLVPLAASAAGPACPTYSDPVEDAAPINPALYPVAGDPALDLLDVTHSTAAGILTTTVHLAALHDYGSEYSFGDWFEVGFTVVEKAVLIDVVRDANVEGTTTTSVEVDGTVTDLEPEAVHDFEQATVTIALRLADLEKAVGATLKGQAFTAMRTRALGYYLRPGLVWDIAAPEAEVTYTVGDACKSGAKPKPAPSAATSPSAAPSPSGSPSPSASPSASASATPAPSPTGPPPPPEPAVPVPADGCVGFADEEGDANAAIGPAGSGDDADLDLVSVTGRTTPKLLAGHLAVAELSSGPSFPAFSGHRFHYQFAVGEKVVVLSADQTGPGTGTIDGAVNETLVVDAVFDEPSSQVVLSVERAGLAQALGTALPVGTTLTEVAARSYARTSASTTVADTASPEDPAEAHYVVGDSSCFRPKLTVSSPAQVQSGDRALVDIALTTSDGRAAKGQRISARIGGGPWTAATTDAEGLTSLSLPVQDAAGTRALVVRTSGSAGDGELRNAVRVLVERSILTLRSSGTGATRTVTATLTDDDAPGTPLAGQPVVLTVDGRSVTATTDSRGRTTVSAPADATVHASYAGRTGYTSAAKARTTA